MAPCIDHTAFPHIVDNILGLNRPVPWFELVPHRLLSWNVRERVDQIHLEHILVTDLPYLDAAGKRQTYPAVTSGGDGWPPAFYPLQSPILGLPVTASQYSKALDQINKYTKVIDIFGKPNVPLLTASLNVPIIRVIAGEGWTFPEVFPPWTCSILSISLGLLPYTLKPPEELAARLQQGSTRLVLRPCHPAHFQLPVKTPTAHLDIVYQSYYDVGMVLREVDDLLQLHPRATLTLVGLEGIKQHLGRTHIDRQEASMASVRAQGPDATFMQRLSIFLHTKYCNEPHPPKSKLISCEF